MEVNLWGDAKTTLAALLPLLEQTEDPELAAGHRRRHGAAGTKCSRKRRRRQGRPDQPAPRLPRAQRAAARRRDRHRRCRHDRRLVRPPHQARPQHDGQPLGRLATMLAAMPYAIAAKFAFPDRPVVCTIGDGAFQMLGMNGLITVKRHWEEWANPTFIVLVLHNNDLNQVSWEMREAGDPRYDTSQLLEDIDYAGYAELLGAPRHPGRRPRRGRSRLGRGVRCRPSRRARRHHRQERAAAAGARHASSRRRAWRRRSSRGDPDARHGRQPQRPGRRGAAVRQAHGTTTASGRRVRSAAAPARVVGSIAVDVGAVHRSRHSDARESDGTLDLGRDHDRGRRGRAPVDARASGTPTRAPAAASVVRDTLADVVVGTRPDGDRGDVGRDGPMPSGTRADRVSPARRSPPSTSPCGTSRRSCSGVSVADAIGRVPRRSSRSTAVAGSPASPTAELAEQLDGWVGAGDRRSEDEGRPGCGRRPGAGRGGRDAIGDGVDALRRCQWRLHAQAGAGAWPDQFADRE